MAAGLVVKIATHSVSDLKNGVVFGVGDFIEATPEFFKRYPSEVADFDPRKYPGVDIRKTKKVRFGGEQLNGPAPEAPAPAPEKKSTETSEAAEGSDEAAAEKTPKKAAGMTTADLKGGKEK